MWMSFTLECGCRGRGTPGCGTRNVVGFECLRGSSSQLPPPSCHWWCTEYLTRAWWSRGHAAVKVQSWVSTLFPSAVDRSTFGLRTWPQTRPSAPRGVSVCTQRPLSRLCPCWSWFRQWNISQQFQSWCHWDWAWHRCVPASPILLTCLIEHSSPLVTIHLQIYRNKLFCTCSCHHHRAKSVSACMEMVECTPVHRVHRIPECPRRYSTGLPCRDWLIVSRHEPLASYCCGRRSKR